MKHIMMTRSVGVILLLLLGITACASDKGRMVSVSDVEVRGDLIVVRGHCATTDDADLTSYKIACYADALAILAQVLTRTEAKEARRIEEDIKDEGVEDVLVIRVDAIIGGISLHSSSRVRAGAVEEDRIIVEFPGQVIEVDKGIVTKAGDLDTFVSYIRNMGIKDGFRYEPGMIFPEATFVISRTDLNRLGRVDLPRSTPSEVQPVPTEDARSSGRGVLEVVGHGASPLSPSDLTPSERLTSARTAALVDALCKLAEPIGEVTLEKLTLTPSAQSGEDPKPIDHMVNKEILDVVLGKTLVISRTELVKDGVGESMAWVKWLETSGARARGGVLVKNFTLDSPSIRELDVYEFLHKVHKAGVTLLKWEEHWEQDGSFRADVTVRLSVPEQDTGPWSFPRNPACPECREVFSGVVVDVRGFGFQVALSPGIVSVGGLQVYGPWAVERDVVFGAGMATYASAWLTN